MAAQYDEQIDALLAEYRKQREQVGQTVRQLAEVTASATAPRQVVKVTVSGRQGEVTGIEFLTGAYQNMPPKELADVLIKAIGAARAKAMEQVSALLAARLPRLPSGVTLADVVNGTVDPTAVLPEEPSMPASVREYVDRGRDT